MLFDYVEQDAWVLGFAIVIWTVGLTDYPLISVPKR